MPQPSEECRYLGCILGLAIGDAVGTTRRIQDRPAMEELALRLLTERP